MAAFQNAPSPRYLIADSKLYHADNAPNLQKLGFITRIPNTIGTVSQVIAQALTWDAWHRLDDKTRYQCLELCHYGIAQRWLVVHSQAALERAEATIIKAKQREEEAIEKQLFHLQATRFKTPEVAHDALAALAKRWTYHQVESYTLIEHKRYAGKGRPTPHTPLKAIEWQIQGQVRPDQEAMWHHQHVKACFVLGTNIDASQLSDAAVIAAYKSQSCVEGGFRFLKAPLFFVSSLFVKKPSRMEGLLMVMTLALLVYSVAQRRMRQQLAHRNETVPNQINQPTVSPTLRWVFQLLEGIHRVRVTVQGQVHDLIEGLNDVQIKILRLFGEQVCCLYQISSG
jgi:transposase